MKSESHHFDIKIKLTSALLGAHRQHDGQRTINTTKYNDVLYFVPDQIQWRWALREAMDSLGILGEVDIDFVRLPAQLKCPAIRIYTRRWDNKDQAKSDTFECFQANTVITIPVFILSQLEQTNKISVPQRPPTKEELIECFRIIGNLLGISPWGSKFGYGRFVVID